MQKSDVQLKNWEGNFEAIVNFTIETPRKKNLRRRARKVEMTCDNGHQAAPWARSAAQK